MMTRSISFRLLLPIVVLLFCCMALLYGFVLSEISDFASQHIQQMLTDMKSDITGICEMKDQDLFLNGQDRDDRMLRIQKARTISLIENYARTNRAQVKIYEDATLLYSDAPLTTPGESTSSVHKYYSMTFAFEPWGWEIIISKNAAHFSSLLAGVRRTYVITFAILALMCLLLFALYSRMIARPLKAMVARIKRGEAPSYDGSVQELEFLAASISRLRENLTTERNLLAREKARAEGFLAGMSEPVIVLDAKRDIIFENPGAVNLLGNVVGKNCREVLCASKEPVCTSCAIALACDHPGGSHRRDVRISVQAAQGNPEVREVEIVASVLAGGDPQAPQCIVSLHDITRQRTIQKELNQHRQTLQSMVDLRTRELLDINQRLTREIASRKQFESQALTSRKLEAISVLSAGIAHDFNNIISIIVNNITLARMGLPLNASPAEEQLSRAERACLRARHLTDQLLTFSKSGVPVSKPSSLAELLEETVDFAFKGSSIRADLHMADNLHPININEGQISQVLGNIMINAEQAMPQGGTVRIRAENVEVAPEEIPDLAPGQYVRVSIQDEGMGMDEETRQRIFDPYFSTKEGGSGLGLSTSYMIIKRHGGALLVDCIAQQSTTFLLYLPATTAAIAQGAVQEGMSITGASGRILLMDDEPDLRQTLSELLGLYGFTTVTSPNGHDAIAAYRQALQADMPFDAVVLDLTVPGSMGGVEAMQHIRSITPEAIIIASTGYVDVASLQEGRDGFNAILGKPYKPESLVETLVRLIRPHK